jgi:hypothetical protein
VPESGGPGGVLPTGAFDPTTVYSAAYVPKEAPGARPGLARPADAQVWRVAAGSGAGGVSE